MNTKELLPPKVRGWVYIVCLAINTATIGGVGVLIAIGAVDTAVGLAVQGAITAATAYVTGGLALGNLPEVPKKVTQ